MDVCVHASMQARMHLHTYICMFSRPETHTIPHLSTVTATQRFLQCRFTVIQRYREREKKQKKRKREREREGERGRGRAGERETERQSERERGSSQREKESEREGNRARCSRRRVHPCKYFGTDITCECECFNVHILKP